MSRAGRLALPLRSAYPQGRYIQSLAESEADYAAEAPDPPKVRARTGPLSDLAHAVPIPDETSAAPIIRTRQWRLPWRKLAVYPLTLAVSLGLIYLAYRFRLTSHWLFPWIVAVMTLLLVVGMFIWGLLQDRYARIRRQRLRMQMAEVRSHGSGEENPARPLYDQGQQLIKMGEYEDAIVYLRKALQLDANYLEAYQALGNAYNALGEPELAVEMTQRAFELKAQHHSDSVY